MSRRFAKKLYNLYDITSTPSLTPSVRWAKGKGVESFFTFAIPYDIAVARGGKVASIEPISEEEGCTRGGMFQVRISESDLFRLLKADKVSDEVYFSFVEEQGDLSDVVFYCISLIQDNWYLSQDILNKAKRASKKIGYPQWITLIKRENKGGQRKGVLKKERVMSAEEKERLESLVSGHDKIVENCLKHDWAEEYCELEKEVAKYKGEQVLSKKKYLQMFSELRKRFNANA